MSSPVKPPRPPSSRPPVDRPPAVKPPVDRPAARPPTPHSAKRVPSHPKEKPPVPQRTSSYKDKSSRENEDTEDNSETKSESKKSNVLEDLNVTSECQDNQGSIEIANAKKKLEAALSITRERPSAAGLKSGFSVDETTTEEFESPKRLEVGSFQQELKNKLEKITMGKNKVEVNKDANIHQGSDFVSQSVLEKESFDSRTKHAELVEKPTRKVNEKEILSQGETGENEPKLKQGKSKICQTSSLLKEILDIASNREIMGSACAQKSHSQEEKHDKLSKTNKDLVNTVVGTKTETLVVASESGDARKSIISKNDLGKCILQHMDKVGVRKCLKIF